MFFDNIKNIFKEEKCSICNNIYFISNLTLKEDKYICKNCKKNFDKINNCFDDDLLFEKSNFDKILESITKKESIRSIEFSKKLEQYKIAEKKRKEKNNEMFQYNLQNLRFITPENSNIKVSKKALKDMPVVKFKNITSKTSLSSIDNFVVIDTETTGLRPSVDELLEVSAIRFIDYEPTECLTTLIKPKKTISNEIEHINHISNEMVEKSPNVEYIIQSFSNFIEDYNVVGYNLEFDLNFLYKNGLDFFNKKRYFYDVLPLCKKIFKEFNLPNYKLDTICEYLGIKRNHAHRATEDALATGIIFRDIGHSIKEKFYNK